MILELNAQFHPISSWFIYDTLVGEGTGLNRLAEAFVENILAKQRQFKILIHAEQIAKPGIKRRPARQKFIYRVVETGKLAAGLLEADLSAQLIVADIKCLLYQPRKSCLWRMGSPLARKIWPTLLFREEETVIFGIEQTDATLN